MAELIINVFGPVTIGWLKNRVRHAGYILDVEEFRKIGVKGSSRNIRIFKLPLMKKSLELYEG